MAARPVRSTSSQASIFIKIGSDLKEFRILRCFQVIDLKAIISKLTGIPISDQRLFHGHVELSNQRILEDYGLFEASVLRRSLLLENSRLTGYFIRAIPGAFYTKEVIKVIDLANQGLRINLAPQLTWDGTGGTYFLKDVYKNVRGVFKPIDEEPFTPNNPRGYVGSLNSQGIRAGIKSGTSGFKEIAAYLLDHSHFSSVPATGLVESKHPTYKYGLQDSLCAKKGSFQVFISNLGSIEDFSVKQFPNIEVQKIAILDIRVLNMDRNVANILVTPEKKLIPIDHGLSIPEALNINEYDLCWMDFPQSKDLIEESCLEYISMIDPLKDISFLKENFSFPDKSLMFLRISSILLKKGAQAGLSLNQIGSLLYRKEYESSPSVIEEVVQKSIEFYKTITKSLTTRLILEKNLYSKSKKRPRAYSSHEDIELIHFGDVDTTNYSSNSEDACEVFLTIKEEEEEDEEEVFITDNYGRSISLPCLASLISPAKKEEPRRAFDNKLFYYIEAFIDLAIEKKIRDLNSKDYLEFNVNGRMRSLSDVNCLNDDFQYTLVR
jgi:hypothetical protein